MRGCASFLRDSGQLRSGRARFRNWLSGATLLLAAIGCGLTATGAVLGGETHFLGGCGTGCRDGLSCIAAICTRACADAALDCGDLAASVSCRPATTAEPYCDLPCTTDASCRAEGAGLACEAGFCRASAPVSERTSQLGRADDPWWCLDLEPPALPAPQPDRVVGFVAPIVDWSTRAPMAGNGLVSTLCAAVDTGCERPLTPSSEVSAETLGDQPLPLGTGGMLLPEGFDGFIQLDVSSAGRPQAERYMPVAYFLGGAASGDISIGAPIVMIQLGLWPLLVEQSFVGVDAGAVLAQGQVMANVYDCNGNAVENARVELRLSGVLRTDVTAFFLPASFIPVAQPAEDLRSSFGGFGYLGLPAGIAQLSAFRPEDDRLIGQIELGIAPERVAMGLIRPSYFLDARVPGSPSTLAEIAGANP